MPDMIRIVPAVLITIIVLPAWGADKPPANPAATKLLADARAARAQWDHFSGFRARLEINVEGQVAKGTVEVSPKGKVTVQVAEAAPEAVKWAKDQLASLAAHRLDNSASADTPCAFLDENPDHPLGRAIRVLEDEFHSSYRGARPPDHRGQPANEGEPLHHHGHGESAEQGGPLFAGQLRGEQLGRQDGRSEEFGQLPSHLGARRPASICRRR